LKQQNAKTHGQYHYNWDVIILLDYVVSEKQSITYLEKYASLGTANKILWEGITSTQGALCNLLLSCVFLRFLEKKCRRGLSLQSQMFPR